MKKNDFLRDIIEAKYGVRKAPVTEVGNGQQFAVVIGPDFDKIAQLLEQYA